MASIGVFLLLIAVFVATTAICGIVMMISKGIGIVLAAITNVSNASDELAADFSNSIKWN